FSPCYFLLFFKSPAPLALTTPSLHDALPIYRQTRVCLSIEFHLPGKCRSIPYDQKASRREVTAPQTLFNGTRPACNFRPTSLGLDRKSTRLNSSHGSISYAVFCLKKKKT